MAPLPSGRPRRARRRLARRRRRPGRDPFQRRHRSPGQRAPTTSKWPPPSSVRPRSRLSRKPRCGPRRQLARRRARPHPGRPRRRASTSLRARPVPRRAHVPWVQVRVRAHRVPAETTPSASRRALGQRLRDRPLVGCLDPTRRRCHPDLTRLRLAARGRTRRRCQLSALPPVRAIGQVGRAARVVRAWAVASAVVRVAALAGQPDRAVVSVAVRGVRVPVVPAQASALVQGVALAVVVAATASAVVARAVRVRAPARVPDVPAAVVGEVRVAGPVVLAVPSVVAAASPRAASRSVRSGRNSTTSPRRR